MIRILLLMCAVFTSLFAILNSVFVFMSPDGSTLWNMSRILAALFIIGTGVLTQMFFLPKNGKHNLRQFLSLCSMGLMLLGIAGFSMAIYFGRTTGDFEYYLFPIHALLFGQGALTFWNLRQKALVA